MDVETQNNMVVGLIFSPDFEQVILIEKRAPEWQAGLLNGVGGKAKPEDKSVIDTMVRECFEETGLLIEAEEWTMAVDMIIMERKCRIVFFFCSTPKYFNAMTKEEEHVGIYLSDSICHREISVIPNLKWIIPLCRSWDAQMGGTKVRRVIVDMRVVKI